MSENAAARPFDPTRPAPGEPGLSRRERKKERTRSEIYRAAMQLFSERGFDQVTVEQVCEAADVARGTFFAHFPTKSALLFEFHRAMAADFESRLSAPRAPAIDELRSLVDQLAAAWLQHADVMGPMLREFLGSPGAFAAAGHQDTQLPRLIEEIVSRGQRRGELRTGLSPRLAAAAFLSTAAAILAGGVFQEGAVTPAEVRDQFLGILLHGLVAPASGSPGPSNPIKEIA